MLAGKCKIVNLSMKEFEEKVRIYYRYMYLKTYAKFTFCIKSQGHVSDENFLYYCMHLASKFLPTVSEIYKTERLTFIYCQSFQFFSICTSKHTWIFSVIFSKWLHPERALRQVLLFIALNCLTSAAFITNLCSHLIPVHYKTSTTCTSKRTF